MYKLGDLILIDDQKSLMPSVIINYLSYDYFYCPTKCIAIFLTYDNNWVYFYIPSMNVIAYCHITRTKLL
jgi:hypothetical protein